MRIYEPGRNNDASTRNDAVHCQRESQVWGFWPTLGFTVIMAATWFGADVLVGLVAVLIHSKWYPQTSLEAYVQSLGFDGTVLVATILARTPVTLLLTLLLVRLKKGSSVWEYLALRPVSARVLLVWLGITIVLCLATDWLTILLNQPIIPDFWKKIYSSAGSLTFLLFAIVIPAPIMEEVVFRGFMFKGIERSTGGPIAAVLLTSIVWTLIHVQYDLFELCQVFLFGVFLGIARWKTGSLYTSIAGHMLINLISAIEMAIITEKLTVTG
jgi:uncharacterized protein